MTPPSDSPSEPLPHSGLSDPGLSHSGIGAADHPVTRENSYPSSHRLLTKRQFDAVFQGRERRRTKGQFTVMYSQPNELGRPRLGLVVPKRQARRAVERNTVKRLARESFRVRKHQLGSFDFVLQLTQLTGREDLAEDLARVWDRFATIDRQQPPSRGRSRARGRDAKQHG